MSKDNKERMNQDSSGQDAEDNFQVSDTLFASCYQMGEESREEDESILAEIASIKERYDFVSTIGEGAMKSVHRVFDRKLDIELALAKPKDAMSEASYELFLQEARLTASLDHINIISIHDIGIIDDRPYFTMDLKPGMSLKDFLMENRSDVLSQERLEMILSIFKKICNALSYAHARNVAHLDLKPDNIQIGEFGEVLVCDWGVAKVCGCDEAMDRDLVYNHDFLVEVTHHGKIRGTPGYMAPEQAEGKELTPQSDVYGLGCLLYEMICGNEPFAGDSESKMAQVKRGSFYSPLDRFPLLKCPPALNAVIKKAMSYSQEDRYLSAKDLGQDIERLLAHQITQAEDFSLMRQCQLLYRRNPGATKALMAACILIVVLTVVFIVRLNEEVATTFKMHEDTVEAYALLESQKEQSDMYLEEMERHALQKVYSLNKDGDFEEALSLCDEVLAIYPQARYVIWQKSVNLFSMHQFSRFLDMAKSKPEFFGENSEGLDQLQKISETYAPHMGDEPRLSFEKSLRVFELISSSAAAANYYRYEAKWGRSYDELLKLAILFLAKINEQWNKDYEYSSGLGRRSLILRGAGLKVLTYDKTPVLSRIRLHSLNIQATGISNPKELKGLYVDNLNISNTGLSSLPFGFKLKTLKTLMVSKDQLNHKYLEKIRQMVRVTEL
ncbi:MAG: serine/threonine protein kinase [Planctomycetes bacterium]|nr:serine/threonine protein kinase [Planctomycetota bacterium]